MNADTEYKPIIVNSEPRPVVRKSSVWDMVRFFVYNFLRRPAVHIKQKELKRICADVCMNMRLYLFPFIEKNGCSDCAKAYVIISSQIYLSMIERFLRSTPCDVHLHFYRDFYSQNKSKFDLSESIAAEINGFK